jgi:hypothetical protein
MYQVMETSVSWALLRFLAGVAAILHPEIWTLCNGFCRDKMRGLFFVPDSTLESILHGPFTFFQSR